MLMLPLLSLSSKVGLCTREVISDHFQNLEPISVSLLLLHVHSQSGKKSQ